MATLSTLLAPELAQPGSRWELRRDVNGYARARGDGLATQASAGRGFRVLRREDGRLQVELLEDGYRCWLSLDDVVGRAARRGPWSPQLLQANQIAQRLPAVLAWTEQAEQQSNVYLWGGTTPPDMDCSGLIQSAFASQGIWIPRDAYQQERFCTPVAVRPGDHRLLRPGDLLFFGTPRRCTMWAFTSAVAATATAPDANTVETALAWTAFTPATVIRSQPTTARSCAGQVA